MQLKQIQIGKQYALFAFSTRKSFPLARACHRVELIGKGTGQDPVHRRAQVKMLTLAENGMGYDYYDAKLGRRVVIEEGDQFDTDPSHLMCLWSELESRARDQVMIAAANDALQETKQDQADRLIHALRSFGYDVDDQLKWKKKSNKSKLLIDLQAQFKVPLGVEEVELILAHRRAQADAEMRQQFDPGSSKV